MSADLSFGDIWRGGSRPMARATGRFDWRRVEAGTILRPDPCGSVCLADTAPTFDPQSRPRYPQRERYASGENELPEHRHLLPPVLRDPCLCRRSADLQDGGQRDGVLQDRQRSLVQPSLENLLPAWLAVLRQDQGRRVYLPNYR